RSCLVKSRNNSWTTICVVSNRFWKLVKWSFLTRRCSEPATWRSDPVSQRLRKSSKAPRCGRARLRPTTDRKGGTPNDESKLLVWQNDGERRGGSGSTDPQPARRDREDLFDGDLRLRSAPLQRVHSHDAAWRYSRS